MSSSSEPVDEAGLKIAYDSCQIATQAEIDDGCGDPKPWDPNAELPHKAGKCGRWVNMSTMAEWGLRNAPHNPGFVTPDRWKDNDSIWDATRSRLTDAGCIFAILTLSPTQRGDIFTYDFDRLGELRLSRVPRPPTVIVTQNNIRFVLAWRDTYVLTGGENSIGWLLKTEYPQSVPSFENGWLRAGLVLAPMKVESSPGVGGLDRVLSTIEPLELLDRQFAPNNDHRESTWLWGHSKHGVQLRGTTSTTMVLSIDHPGWLPMTSVPGFSGHIEENNPQTQLREPDDLPTLDGFHYLSWHHQHAQVTQPNTVKASTEDDPKQTSSSETPANPPVAPEATSSSESNIDTQTAPGQTSKKGKYPVLAEVLDDTPVVPGQKPPPRRYDWVYVDHPPTSTPTDTTNTQVHKSKPVEMRTASLQAFKPSHLFTSLLRTASSDGPLQWPDIAQILPSMNIAKQAIEADRAARTIAYSPTLPRDDRDKLLSLLSGQLSADMKVRPWVQAMHQAVGCDPLRLDVIHAALNYRDNESYLKEALEFIKKEDCNEARCYRALATQVFHPKETRTVRFESSDFM